MVTSVTRFGELRRARDSRWIELTKQLVKARKQLNILTSSTHMYGLKLVFGDEGSSIITHGGLRSTNGSTRAPVCKLVYGTRGRWRPKSADGSYQC
jgi:hypothetical protein